MDEQNKTQQRVLTAVGVVVGVLVGIFVFRKVVASKEGLLEIGDFLKGVFAGGIVGIALYLLIKDGVARLLKLRGEGEPRAPRAPRAPRPPRSAPEPPPAPKPAAPIAKERRKEPLRAAGRDRPLRTERPLKRGD